MTVYETRARELIIKYGVAASDVVELIEESCTDELLDYWSEVKVAIFIISPY